MAVLRFAVRVRAGAKRDAVGGQWDGPSGAALLVSVRAPAVDGKANEALCRTLATTLAVPRRDLEVVKGQRSRDKLIEWHNAPEGSAERIAELRSSAAQHR